MVKISENGNRICDCGHRKAQHSRTECGIAGCECREWHEQLSFPTPRGNKGFLTTDGKPFRSWTEKMARGGRGSARTGH